jgi:hypothetical protein
MKIRKNIALSVSGFLFNPLTGDSNSINPIGQEIIKYIQIGKSEEEIKAIIVDEYMIYKDSVEKEFYDFSQMLNSYKPIENEK